MRYYYSNEELKISELHNKLKLHKTKSQEELLQKQPLFKKHYNLNPTSDTPEATRHVGPCRRRKTTPTTSTPSRFLPVVLGVTGEHVAINSEHDHGKEVPAQRRGFRTSVAAQLFDTALAVDSLKATAIPRPIAAFLRRTSSEGILNVVGETNQSGRRNGVILIETADSRLPA